MISAGFISDGVIGLVELITLDVHLCVILFKFSKIEDLTGHVLNLTPKIVHVLHLFDSVNIHGIGGLCQISGQLSECHIVFSMIVIFDAIVTLLSHLLTGTLCLNGAGNNTSLPGCALTFLPLVEKTKGDAPSGVLTK